MEVVRGTVSKVSQTADLDQEGDSGGLSQILSFLVDGRAIELAMPRLPNIHSGDEVIVAGWQKHGTIIGRAYRNLTNGSYGRCDYQAYQLFILDPFVVGVSCLFPPILLLTIPWAFRTWSRAVRTYRAFGAVNSLASSRTNHSYEEAENTAAPVVPLPPPLPKPAPPSDVSFNCPKCGKRLRLSAANVGKRVRCSSKDCAAVIDTSHVSG